MFLLQQLSAQVLKVHTGGMYMKSNSFLHLHDTDLETDSDFTGSDNAILKLSTTANKLFLSGSNQPELWHLELNGDCILETNITVKGNFEFRSGIMDIGPHNLNLAGVLLNEGELSYITSSAFGEIVKRASLTANQKMEPGNMGLSLVCSKTYTEVEIRRGHVPQNNGTREGIDRYYSFSQPMDLKQVNIKYRAAELKRKNPEALAVWTKKVNEWEENPTIASISNEILAMGFQSSEIVSLFSSESNSSVHPPEGFSPNGDGVNDLFRIEGLERYPNAKFTAFNRWGNKLYEKEQYGNEGRWGSYDAWWNGKGEYDLLFDNKPLPTGTYFYILELDASKVIKGTIYINY